MDNREKFLFDLNGLRSGLCLDL
ncbi:uncharacterized protein METZ01_LOCUS137838 [marine metagenome]|uniref:Uncharacterized protein n=1 Tax=marine metagenome TaxID=408172 RepID=A0A381Z757_9ZZZZ